jgi:predicted TPR repeat methyltransferase
MDQKPDHFIGMAPEWDKAGMRVNNARNIAAKIRQRFDLTGYEHIMDFGAGTGLLSEGLAPYVQRITAVDYSGAMLEEFRKKTWPCETEILQIDLSEGSLDHRFDGIVSSMTLHHIADVPRMIQKFFGMLRPGGFLALADLETEPGDFHQINAGVEHFGFQPEYFRTLLNQAGFRNVNTERANVIRKEVEGRMKEFPVFLASAMK